MPVFLEQISQPNPADLDDLNKIYTDYPGLNNSKPDQWLEKTLSSPQVIFAGRFNGRLLAAICAHPTDQDWLIDHLCVRAITRRRGVARQLIELLRKEAEKQHVRLIADEKTTNKEVIPILAASGFQCKQENEERYLWIYDGR